MTEHPHIVHDRLRTERDIVPDLGDVIADRLDRMLVHSPYAGAYLLGRLLAGAVRTHQLPAVAAAIELADKVDRLLAELRQHPEVVEGYAELEVLDVESASLAFLLAATLQGWQR